MDLAMSLLAKASRPIVIAGYGAQESMLDVIGLAEALERTARPPLLRLDLAALELLMLEGSSGAFEARLADAKRRWGASARNLSAGFPECTGCSKSTKSSPTTTPNKSKEW